MGAVMSVFLSFGGVFTIKPTERYQLIDAMRGLAITLMVGYHFGIQLVMFGYAPDALVKNPLLNVLQPVFGGLFILLSGMSSRFSRSNLRRGAIVFACAYAVSVVMLLMALPVWFGILHFLGVAMMFYGVAGPALDKIPRIIQPFLYSALFIVAFFFFPRATVIDTNLLMPLGLYREWGSDYFPLLPWLPLFLFGTWLGALAAEGKLPKWFYRFRMPVLPVIGRHTLVIYLAHQPVIFGVLWVVQSMGGL
jgi:uncharacterized membrane protein